MVRVLWKAAVIALLLMALLILVPSPVLMSSADAEVVELPLRGKGLAFDWANFISQDEYQDPSISVKITHGRVDSSNYMYALIKIANATQIRSTYAGKPDDKSTAKATTLARNVNAVYAVNGDYFSNKRMNYTYIIRQGKKLRTAYVDKKWDLLIIDQNGDFHTIMEPTREKLEAWRDENPDKQIINTFNFGPVLIRNGQNTYADYDDAPNHVYITSYHLAQRVAICQLDTLTYLCVSCEGPDDEKDAGMTINRFMELIRQIESELDGYHIQTAFNLDGGSSTNVVFKDPSANGWKRINGPDSKQQRYVKDILYFASAWQE